MQRIQFTYRAASSPTVSALSPTSGSVNGGTVVTITGTHLTATGMTFGRLTATSFTVVSSTTILATEPPAASTGNIYVTAPLLLRQFSLFFLFL